MRLARRLAALSGSAARVHERFGTATVVPWAGGRLDLATARRETYEHDGALPRVAPGSIEEDLGRRDFTVNAMAIELSPARRPRLLDPFGGGRDLAARRLRILHDRSPFDDPTRGFRAVRYANRLGFKIERRTASAVARAAAEGALGRVSGERIRRELQRIFSEPGRAAAVRGLTRLGLASAIHPSLAATRATLARLRRVEKLATRHPDRITWLAYLLAWTGDLPPAGAREVAARLALEREPRRVLTSWPRTRKELSRADGTGRAGPKLTADEIAAASAGAPESTRRVLENALIRPVLRLTISGRDLLAAGVPSGPSIGRALARTLSALREGEIRPGEELEFAVEAARSEAR